MSKRGNVVATRPDKYAPSPAYASNGAGDLSSRAGNVPAYLQA